MFGWYVMQSKPQKEKWLYRQLGALDIDVYYPCVSARNGKSDSSAVKAYFPRYLFVNVDLQITGTSLLQWIPGSLGLVSFGGEPARVPEALLQRIRHQVEAINGAREKMLQRLSPGDEVMIHSGPFAGYDAIFCARLRDSERVQVFLRVLHEQAIKVDLNIDQIRLTSRN